MRSAALLALASLLGCAASSDTRRARPGPPDGGDTGTGGDTGPGGDADTDTTWSDDDTVERPIVGIDVSRWNGELDWARVAATGVAFAIVKATESDSYLSATFADQYGGAHDAGLIRGAYHFATPDDSDGATQATWFVDNGGGWSADGHTLPGVLDIEYNPYGETCYDKSPREMARWVADFTDTYVARTGRAPLIYSNADWWNTCVGDSAIPSVNPLWVAYWSSGTPTLPDGWSDYTFWQYSSEGVVDGVSGDVDMNRFPGSRHDLRMFANDTE